MAAKSRVTARSAATGTTATLPREVNYPEGDGKPMGESRWHVEALIRLVLLFQERYRLRPDVLVSGNIFLFYVEGEPNKRLSPDVFVALGVPREPVRPSYYLWEMGKAPDVVFEVTSKSTRREDRGKKRRIYAAIGVREYYLYDPLRDWVRGGLQGYRLGAGGYEAIEPDAAGGLVSEALDVRLVLEGGLVQCYDLKSGARLLTPTERAEAESERAEAEAEGRREEAEARRAAGLLLAQEGDARRAAEQQVTHEVEARRQEAEARRLAEARLLELERRLLELQSRTEDGEPAQGKE